MKLNDKVIGHIAKLLQVAIITGTDIVDNLRLLELAVDEEDPALLNLSDNYETSFSTNVNAMIEEVKVNSSSN